MSEVAFDNLRLVHLLWAAAGIVALGVWGLARKRAALRMFADARLIGVLAPPMAWSRPLLRLGLIGLTFAATVAALLGPRWGAEDKTVTTRGVDIMVLLDVSRSMLAKDIAPNRLERAKISITEDLLPAMGGDRIGLIAFAGVPALKCPITNDYGFLRLALDEVNTASSPRGGTLIGDAIRRAAECFKNDGMDTNKLILLITDGEDQDSFPVEAAKVVWEERKIPVIAVALGDASEGARIPIRTDRGEAYLEHGGQTVWSKADFSQLRHIAEASEFKFFFPVGTRNFDLGKFYRENILPAIRYKERSAPHKVEKPSHYQPFAAAALALLLLESLMREGRSPTVAPLVALAERGRAA